MGKWGKKENWEKYGEKMRKWGEKGKLGEIWGEKRENRGKRGKLGKIWDKKMGKWEDALPACSARSQASGRKAGGAG